MAKTLGFIISFGSHFQTGTLDKLRRVRSGPDQHLCIAQNVTQSRNSLSSSLSWATKQHYVRVTYMSTVAGLHANISKACTSLHSLLSIKYLFNTIFKQSFCPFMNSPIFIQNVFCSFFILFYKETSGHSKGILTQNRTPLMWFDHTSVVTKRSRHIPPN